jgi:uncharacterized membrane protein YjjP (DUF1212 family)
MIQNRIRRWRPGTGTGAAAGTALEGVAGVAGVSGVPDVPGRAGGSPARTEAAAFLGRIGPALHRFGASAPSLEGSLERAADRFGLTGHFFSTPTAFFASFELDDDGPPATYLTRIEPGEVDLEKLADLDALLTRVVDADVTIREARASLRTIVQRPARYGAVASVASYVVAAATAALFLGGGWPDLVAAGVLGLLIGALSTLSGRLQIVARIFEPLAAFVAALGAGLAAHATGSVSAYLATVGGLIVLVPGLTVTLSLAEISSRHLVSGTARLTGALGLFLTIGFGVALGTRAVEMLLGPVPMLIPKPLPEAMLLAGLLLAPAAFTVLFRAHPREFPWIAGAASLAFLGARAGSGLFGPELGVFVGAMCVGVAGNAYANRLGRPASVLTVPGLMVLVPGSVGFQSLSLLLASDVVTGMAAAFRMTLVGTALATGLLVANVVLPPRRGL